MKILLVEDNEQVAGFLKKGLMEAGHVADCADNGRDGMLFAESETYDAIIMDRMLPGGIDGLGIIARLRAAGNRVPILIVSALDEVDERIRGLKAGGDDYVVKPFAFGEVLARLEALVRRSDESYAETALKVIGNGIKYCLGKKDHPKYAGHDLLIEAPLHSLPKERWSLIEDDLRLAASTMPFREIHVIGTHDTAPFGFRIK